MKPPALLAVAALVLATGCDPTKRLPAGKRLLVRNEVRTNSTEVPASELATVLKQKPNKKILGQRFHLHLYNLSDPERTIAVKAASDSVCALRNEERARKAAERNARRKARGRKERPFAPKECRKTRRVWAREHVGEAPVVLDSALIEQSRQQMALYLAKEGYYRSSITDSVSTRRRKLFTGRYGRPFSQPKAEVVYHVDAGRPYRLCEISWRVDDPRMDSLLRANASATLVKRDMRFDADELDKERTRITDLMRQHGYLFFTRDLVQYVADTAAGDHEVDLSMRLEQPLGRAHKGLRGTPEGTVYVVEDVEVEIMPRPGATLPPMRSSMDYQGLKLHYQGERPQFRPRALRNQVLLKSGAVYSQTATDRTYRRLNNLRVFDRVEIRFDTSGTEARDRTNVNITLLPSKRQNFSTEVFGTNRGGFLGTSVSFLYRHKNVFRNMGSITTQMTFGLEAQQGLTGNNSPTDDATIDVRRVGMFNTLEMGPEITLRFPRFMLPAPRAWLDPDKWARSWNQRTSITSLYNYQQRPDYTRSLAKISFGYEWNKGRSRTWGLFPMDVNFIRIHEMTGAFADFIRTSNDAILRDSYTDHVIAGAKLVYTWNTQNAAVRSRDMFFWRPIVQTSGLLLNAINEAFDGAPVTDTTGTSYYTLAGVRFAQFVKVENDFRYYRTIHTRSSLAFRAAAGIGVPFGNLGVMPFEASFFGGGANGMRAWRPRTLGPGSYSAPIVAFDRIGEIRIEGNAEYRFKLVGYVEGALFADVGNIWTIEENPAKPGSGFRWDRFYNDLAVGTGMGLRLNFDFFLVRFDFGLQTKDPALAPGERWIFQPKDRFALDRASPDGTPARYRAQVNFNLGIGYPF